MAFLKSLFGAIAGAEQAAADAKPPPPRSEKIYGKFFFAKNMSNGLMLNIKEGTVKPGSAVVTWNKKPAVTSFENQLWYQDLSTGTIRSVLNDFCLDLASGSALLKYWIIVNSV